MTAALACLLALFVAPAPVNSAPVGSVPVNSAPVAAAEDDAPPPVALEAFELELTLPPLEGLQGGAIDMGQVQARWSGQLDATDVRINLLILPSAQFGFAEPTSVADLVLDHYRGQDRPYEYDPQRVQQGPFGYVPYSVLTPYAAYESTLQVGAGWILCGLLTDAGYTLEVELDGVPTDEQRAAIETFLASGVRFTGAQRVVEWTEEEIEARMAADLPASLDDERVRFLRTDHYIVFGNSSGAKSFAKKVEECYDAIRETFPFEEIEGQRLMPIFLFRTRDQYIDFLQEKIGWSRQQAAQSGGVASQDWYATTYNDPNDPTHLHELTHQIFGNRLLLSGGGSWFQEGVAEYMETVEYSQVENQIGNFGKTAAKRADREGPDAAVAEGEYIRMRKIMTMPSMLYSSPKETKKGGSGAGMAYSQAGSIIYFVMKDKRTRDKAQEFIHRIGGVRRGDLPAIERELRALFNVGIDGFEEMYLEFWKKGR